MNKFLRLFKFKLNNQFGLSSLKANLAVPSMRRKAYFTILIALIILVCLIVPYTMMMVMLYQSFAYLDSADMYLKSMMTIAQIMVFFTVILTSFNSMFNGREQELLRPLPVKREHIFLTSYVVLYVTALATSLMVLIPGFGVYMYFEGVSIPMIIKGLVGAIMFPALPTAIGTLIMFLLMSVAGRFKHKELISTILSIAFLAGYIVFYTLMSSEISDITTESLAGILDSNIGLIDVVATYMINVFVYMKLMGTGTDMLIGLVASLVIFAVAFLIMYYLGGFLFEKVTDKLANSAVRKKVKHIESKASSARVTIIKKEFKTMLRTPTYVLNCMINVIIGPLIMVMLGLRMKESTVEGDTDIIDLLSKLLKDNQDMSYVVCAVITILTLFIIATALVASTCVSREGKSYWLTKIMPVSLKDQINAKLICALIINVVCVITMMAIGGVMFGLSFLPVLIGIIVCVIASITFGDVGAIVDVIRPKIYWERETEAVKQNSNGMIAMAVCAVIAVFDIIPVVLYIAGMLTNIVIVVVLTFVIELAFLIAGKVLLNRIIQNKESHL